MSAAHVFPRRHLVRLTCPFDAASLLLVDTGPIQPQGIVDGVVQCTTCQRRYPINCGVLELLSHDVGTDPIAAREQELWDIGAADYDARVTHGRQTLNAM